MNPTLTKDDIDSKRLFGNISDHVITEDKLDNLNGIVLSDYAEKQAVLRWLDKRDLNFLARGISPPVLGHYRIVEVALEILYNQLQKEIDNV